MLKLARGTLPLSRKTQEPNGSKLSDGGRKGKEFTLDATPPFAGARG